QQVRYAELTVTPDSHLLAGIEPDALSEALIRARRRARREHGVELAWIFDIPGELGLESGVRTIDWVERWAPEGSIGLGLGGPEIGVPRPQFDEVFGRARTMGLHSLPHAGETTGPETIWDAIRHLGAERIGHGISSVDDPELIRYLKENDIALEVCPTSNLCTRAVDDIEHHPMPSLMEKGVTVTLNSDDPGMFNTTLNREYELAHDVFGIDAHGLANLVHAAVAASYASETMKRELRAEIDYYIS
ncbi:MAG: adenosine deaminase, partial [Acidimicrobiia bacterium]|nr:adenosine deaminase [Acidimicrobiia bacterium]